jgi:mannitol-1-phosphate/altronate dehydrogenase
VTERADQKALVFGTGMFLRAFLCDFADRAGVPVTLVSSTPAGDERVAQLNRRAARARPLAFTLAYRGLGDDGQSRMRGAGRLDPACVARLVRWAEVLETAHDPAITTVASNVSESGMRLSDEARLTGRIVAARFVPGQTCALALGALPAFQR